MGGRVGFIEVVCSMELSGPINRRIYSTLEGTKGKSFYPGDFANSIIVQKEFPAGIVEGFYGSQWSHLDRLYMIRFLSDNDFNAYMYAPKDDPYHRSRWREEYPESLARAIHELIEAANLYSVDFIFTVSPGLSMKYSDPNEVDLLFEKLQTVIELGCSWIGVLLDDIDVELHFEEDRKSFSTLAKAHSYLLNTLSDRLGDKIRITFCPTYYANDYLGKQVEENDYLAEIGMEMKKDIDVLWTGRHVVSTMITEEDVIKFETVVRRKPLLWDNYPVNDYFHSKESDPGFRLNLGPFAGRDPKILDHLSGYLANPMNECEASKISLLTLREMLDSPSEYSPQQSMGRAIGRFFSESCVEEEMQILLEVAKATPFDPLEAENVRTLVRQAISSYRSIEGREKSFSELRVQLDVYSRLKQDLRAKLRNKKLFFELEPVLAKLRSLVALGEKSLELAELLLEKSKRDSSIIKLSEELNKEADDVKKDKTQVLGQINFGALSSSDMGIPLFKSESPIIGLYEWVKGLSS